MLLHKKVEYRIEMKRARSIENIWSINYRLLSAKSCNLAV
jgi:hypothetical protein